MRVITKISLFRKPFTIFYMSEEFSMLPKEEHYKLIGVKVGDCGEIQQNEEIFKKVLKLKTNALFLYLFVKECVNSDVYRRNVVTNMYELSGYPKDGLIFLNLILEPPDTEIIDYSWNEKLLKLLWMKLEIENAFSWLSTLGGAYSALGDYFEDCAEEAGRISIRQYRLSQMLGDDSLAARSKLYAALSQAQKGNLHISRNIVRSVANFAQTTHDKRLLRMCHGVWAKLKYLRTLKKKNILDEKKCDSGDAKDISV